MAASISQVSARANTSASASRIPVIGDSRLLFSPKSNLNSWSTDSELSDMYGSLERI